MKQILGESPATSIIGAIIAALLIIQEAIKAGDVDWTNVAIAVAVAVLMRFMPSTGKIAEVEQKVEEIKHLTEEQKN